MVRTELAWSESLANSIGRFLTSSIGFALSSSIFWDELQRYGMMSGLTVVIALLAFRYIYCRRF